MTAARLGELGAYLKKHRIENGLSIRELARRAQLDPANISRIEQGIQASASVERLQRIARVLEVHPQELYRRAGYNLSDSLPELKTYLRAKYDMPADAINQIESYFDYVNKNYKQEGEGDDEAEHTG